MASEKQIKSTEISITKTGKTTEAEKPHIYIFKKKIRDVLYVLPGTKKLWITISRFFGSDPGSPTPGTQKLWTAVLKKIGVADGHAPDFSGWGMTTHTFPPWQFGGGDEVAKKFLETHNDIYNRVTSGQFKLAQFDHLKVKKEALHELMWRHYMVFWSASYAAKTTRAAVKNLVECGVCDGLTVSFAMQALAGKSAFKAFLYDAWDGMKREHLLESEKSYDGEYSYLNIENTKKNLSAHSAHTIFNKGYIPESFEKSENPSEVAWLHIDLNSAIITAETLKFFFDKISSGGVILFDDYAWRGYYDTKMAVDEFFREKPGMLFHLPTGQAIYFRAPLKTS